VGQSRQDLCGCEVCECCRRAGDAETDDAAGADAARVAVAVAAVVPILLEYTPVGTGPSAGAPFECARLSRTLAMAMTTTMRGRSGASSAGVALAVASGAAVPRCRCRPPADAGVVVAMGERGRGGNRDGDEMPRGHIPHCCVARTGGAVVDEAMPLAAALRERE
jgi:hypothetical protein